MLSKKRVWSLLEPANEKDLNSKLVDMFLLMLITLNIIMVVVEIVDGLIVLIKTNLDKTIVMVLDL